MRKLCYICEATAGGMRKHLRLLIRQFTLPVEGFQVHALVGDRGEPGFQEEIQSMRKMGIEVTPVPGFCRAIRPWRDAPACAFIRKHLRRLAPDIVHTHASKAGFLGRLAADACCLPRIIHTPHVFPFQWAKGLGGALYLRLERFAARRCHAIVCVSRGQYEEALRRRVAPADRLFVVHNGVARREPPDARTRAALRVALGLPVDAPIIGMVSRLAPQKGIHVFLQAAAKVVHMLRGAVCVLAGSGPLDTQVRRWAAELNLGSNHLRLLGHVADTEKLYPVFDVLAHSSLYEGLPYALLEAMACGVPVVATDVMGCNEVVVDGASGLLARAGDPSDLADKVFYLVSNERLRARLSAGGLERVRQYFSLEAFHDGHRRLYLGGV